MSYPVPGTFAKFFDVRGVGGNGISRRRVTIAASQNIKYGDLLDKTSGANTFEQALALPGANNSATAQAASLDIPCVALESIETDAAGEADDGRTTIEVAILDQNCLLALPIYNATAANAEPRDLALLTAYEVTRWRGASASDWWYAFTSATTYPEFAYSQRYAGSADDDDYGIVWGKRDALVGL